MYVLIPQVSLQVLIRLNAEVYGRSSVLILWIQSHFLVTIEAHTTSLLAHRQKLQGFRSPRAQHSGAPACS